MPHELDFTNKDYAEQSQARIDAELAHAQRVIDIANEIMRCGIECETKGFPCDMCGNPRCKEAWEAKLKLEAELGI